VAQTVAEIMNRELFVAREHDRVGDLLQYLVALGITGAPVTDREERPVGFVSLRDLVGGEPTDTIRRRMSVPVDTIAATATITEAAERMCELGRHHLVTVGDDGRPIGFVSALDVLRGVTGQPVPHPDAFPHWDPETGLAWTNEMRFAIEPVRESAPSGPGLFVLVHARRGAPNRIVWSEAAGDVEQRLLDILTMPGAAPSAIAPVIDSGELWFRAARAPSAHALPEAASDH
jgi:CBS domain-containing protein